MPYCCATLISLISARAAGIATSKMAASNVAHRAVVRRRPVINVIAETSLRVAAAAEASWGRIAAMPLGALIQPREYELAVAKRLGGGEASVCRPKHHVEEFVAGFIHRDLALQQARRVDVDVLAHRAHGARIRTDLDD